MFLLDVAWVVYVLTAIVGWAHIYDSPRIFARFRSGPTLNLSLIIALQTAQCFA